jgi:membrane protein
MAASVSYYAMLSMFPLIIAISAIIGWIAGSDARQDELVEFVVDFVPGSEQFARDSIEGAERFRKTFGAIAILGLIWSGSAVFGSINRIVNRAWNVHGKPPFIRNKPRQLAMALAVGILFFLSVGITGFVHWATTIEIGSRTASEILGGDLVPLLLRAPAALITFIIFLSIYKFLPNTKTYWKYVWTGAAVATVLFEISKTLFLYYLSAFAVFDQLYGSVASVIVLMIWTYLCSMVLVFGAEVAAEYSRVRGEGRPSPLR